MTSIPKATLRSVEPVVQTYEDLENVVSYAIANAAVKRETKTKVFHSDPDLLHRMAVELKEKDYSAFVTNTPAYGNMYQLTIVW